MSDEFCEMLEAFSGRKGEAVIIEAVGKLPSLGL